MKLFYFGSVCSQEVFNATVANSKVKPSASAQNFENALIRGFAQNHADLTVASAESIAQFPQGNRLILKKRMDLLPEGIVTSVIPAINLPFLKQACHASGADRLLKKWLKENKNDRHKCVLTYGIYPAVVKRLQRTCKKYGCKMVAVVTDVPSTMFTYTQSSPLKRLLSKVYRKSAIALQDQFDGYIYLTEAMAGEVAPGKPYIVAETIADITIFNNIGEVPKATPPAIMYAGALYQKYGVDLIVESFKKTRENCQLWLFGSGDYEEQIAEAAKNDPHIRFFGRVSREDVLRYEKKATLLLNLRNADDDYTKYSFPSKMVEYMLSGTPLLTSELEGIPSEYYSYCYVINDRDAQSVAKEIDRILHMNGLAVVGSSAASYIKKHKNCVAQTERILNFMKSI